MGWVMFVGLDSSGEGSFLGLRGVAWGGPLVCFRRGCDHFFLLGCAPSSEPEEVKTGVLRLVLAFIVLFVLWPVVGTFCGRD